MVDSRLQRRPAHAGSCDKKVEGSQYVERVGMPRFMVIIP
jgi:hypothetical protein